MYIKEWPLNIRIWMWIGVSVLQIKVKKILFPENPTDPTFWGLL